MEKYKSLIPNAPRKTQRWVSERKTVIIPGKIRIVPSQFFRIGRSKPPEAPLLMGILRRDWKNRARYIYEIVIGGTKYRRIRGKGVTPVAYIMEDGEVES